VPDRSFRRRLDRDRSGVSGVLAQQTARAYRPAPADGEMRPFFMYDRPPVPAPRRTRLRFSPILAPSPRCGISRIRARPSRSGSPGSGRLAWEHPSSQDSGTASRLDLIEQFHQGERTAAHTLALMNMAALDAISLARRQVTYWLIGRPRLIR